MELDLNQLDGFIHHLHHVQESVHVVDRVELEMTLSIRWDQLEGLIHCLEAYRAECAKGKPPSYDLISHLSKTIFTGLTHKEE